MAIRELIQNPLDEMTEENIQGTFAQIAENLFKKSTLSVEQSLLSRDMKLLNLICRRCLKNINQIAHFEL